MGCNCYMLIVCFYGKDLKNITKAPDRSKIKITTGFNWRVILVSPRLELNQPYSSPFFFSVQERGGYFHP